jgi:hypothetical protein
MYKASQLKQDGADQGGAPAESQGRPSLTVDEPFKPPGVFTGKPSVAANSGAEVPKALLKAFQVAGELWPEWYRLPAPGARDRMTGLSRTSLNEAIERGDVKAITVRQPGAVRGIKLLNVASVRAWMARLDAEQNDAAKERGAS